MTVWQEPAAGPGGGEGPRGVAGGTQGGSEGGGGGGESRRLPGEAAGDPPPQGGARHAQENLPRHACLPATRDTGCWQEGQER